MTAGRPARANPYVGPRAFQRGERLFGRAAELQRLLDLLIAERIVLCYSPSGAGKSSLIQAALIPALEAEAFFVLPVMRVGAAPPAPERRPDDDLLSALLGAAPPAAGSRYLASALASLDAGLHPRDPLPPGRLAGLSLAAYLRERAPSPRGTTGRVLIFDQFEEILTVDPTGEDERVEFFRQVGALLRDRSLWALFALREDYLAGLDPYLRPIPTRFANTFRLDLLGVPAAIEAIRAPARQAGVTFAAQAAARMADDLRGVRVQLPDGSTELRLGPHVEPVQLQVVCYRLWEQLFPPGGAHPPVIAPSDVAAVTDVDATLGDYYAQCVGEAVAASGADERAVRDWFDRRLITPQGIRGQVLREPRASGGLDNRAVARLIDAHLVRAEQRGGATWLELAHDRLIEPVRESNARWREANLSTLQRQADLWEKRGRPDGLLLSGAELRAAEAWAAQAPLVTEVERAFLAECVQARRAAERERRAARIIRALGLAAITLAALAVVAATLAWQQRGEALANFARAEGERQTAVAAQATSIARRDAAERQSRAALSSQARLLAAEAVATVPDDPQLARLLALEAAARDPGPRAEEALRLTLRPNSGFARRLRHDDSVVDLAFSPDGARLLTVAGQARIWRVDTSAGPRLLGAPDGAAAIASADWSPDGRLVATGGGPGPVTVWDAESGAPLLRIADAPAPLVRVRFSPDGLRLLAAGGGGSVLRYDVATGEPAGAPIVAPDTLRAAAWLPDGRGVVTAGPGAVIVWDGDSGAAAARLDRAPDEPGALAVSPDGRRVAVASLDGGLLVWEPATGSVTGPYLAHDSAAYAVAWSPDGLRLATVGSDGALRTWGAGDLSLLQELFAGPEAEAGQLSVAFSPDGRRIATGAALGPPGRPAGPGGFTRSDPVDALVWDPGLPALIAHDGAVRDAAFSADGRRFATAGDDGVARVWDAAGGALLLELEGHGAELSAVAFAPDGRVLTAGRDGTARLWGASGEEELRMEGGGPALLDAALSPDGGLAAAVGADGALRVWSTADGAERLRVAAHSRGATSVSFSPDGALLLTAGLDNAARLWGAGDGAPRAELPAPAEGLERAAFAADGRHVLIATSTGVYVWDSAGAAQPRPLSRDAGPVRAVAASPGEQSRIVAVGARGAHLWDIGAGRGVLVAGGQDIVGATFSPDGAYVLSYAESGRVALDYARGDAVLAAVRWRVERELAEEERERYLGDD